MIYVIPWPLKTFFNWLLIIYIEPYYYIHVLLEPVRQMAGRLGLCAYIRMDQFVNF